MCIYCSCDDLRGFDWDLKALAKTDRAAANHQQQVRNTRRSSDDQRDERPIRDLHDDYDNRD